MKITQREAVDMLKTLNSSQNEIEDAVRALLHSPEIQEARQKTMKERTKTVSKEQLQKEHDEFVAETA
jgi:spore germination protein GerM